MNEQVFDDIFLEILSEIEHALNNKLYIAALCLAVMIPDICGKAEYNKQCKTSYIKWYDRYIGDRIKPGPPHGEDMPYLSGEVVYYFRNSILHNGNLNVPKDKIHTERCKIDRFEIVVGEGNYRQVSRVRYCGNQEIYYRSFKMNVTVFCYDIINAAREYYNQNKDKFRFNYSFSHEVIP